MNTFHYFSYGSNMLTERLQARCPSARVMGVGQLRGYELSFWKLSKKDHSGKAMPSSKPQANEPVYGILFEISKDELKALDRAEGEGYGYDRCDDCTIYLRDEATKLQVTTYLANADYIDQDLQPFDWYLALVIAGARQHALPKKYIERLRAISSNHDTTSERPVRLAALEALRAAGVADFKRLLLA